MTSAMLWIALLSTADARPGRTMEEDDLLAPRQVLAGTGAPAEPPWLHDPAEDLDAELHAGFFGPWTMART